MCAYSRHTLRRRLAVLIGLAGLLAGHLPAAAGDAFKVTSLKEARERGVVMQEWETSCAAAAAATVLTYGFRDPVSERAAVADMLSRTDPAKVKARGGFSLLDLKMFVEGRGYQGNAYKYLAFDDLRVFHAPIVPIHQHGDDHYVVVNGVRGDRVLIADPAFGNREVPIERFVAMWMDGIAFVVTRAGDD